MSRRRLEHRGCEAGLERPGAVLGLAGVDEHVAHEDGGLHVVVGEAATGGVGGEGVGVRTIWIDSVGMCT